VSVKLHAPAALLPGK